MSSARRAHRILIVDDHRMMREGLRHMLAGNASFEIVADAADVATAWSAMEHHKPDLVLKTNGPTELLAALTTVLEGKIYLCTDAATAMVRAGRPLECAPVAGRGDNTILTPREKQVLRLVVQGLRNKEIAEELGIGIKSVETYRSRLMKRLECSSPAELVRTAIRRGLAEL